MVMRAVVVGVAAGLAVVLGTAGTATAAAFTSMVGAANTVAGSWWGTGSYADCSAPITAGSTGDVEVTEPTVTGGTADASTVSIGLFDAATAPDPTVGSFTPGALAVVDNGGSSATVGVTEGAEYVICLTSWDPTTHDGWGLTDSGLRDALEAAGPPPVEPLAGEGAGIGVDPTSGQVFVTQDVFVSGAIVVWLATVVLGLATSWLVLP